MHTLNSSNSAPHLHDAVSQMELRAAHPSTAPSRFEESIRQLNTLAAGAWPSDATVGFELAIRLLSLASTLAENKIAQSATLQLAEFSVGRIGSELPFQSLPADETARTLLQTWHKQQALPRDLVAEIFVEAAPVSVLDSLLVLLEEELDEGANQLHPVDFTASLFRRGSQPEHRDYVLFHAKAQAARGMIDASIRTLSQTEVDADILEASAELLADDGNFEGAIERLRRALVLRDDRQSIREQLYQLLKDAGHLEAAHQELFALLRESGDVLYWNILVNDLHESNPEALVAYRELLADKLPGLNVEILIHEGDLSGVVAASKGKNFNASELWRIAQYLRSRRPGAALQLYLRSFSLGGATARTRQECETYGNQLESVLPFFEAQNATARLKKTVKDALARHKRNIPLERELERVFGPSFRR